jgi:hypothetical protein
MKSMELQTFDFSPHLQVLFAYHASAASCTAKLSESILSLCGTDFAVAVFINCACRRV